MSNSNQQEEKPLSLQQIREALREDIRAELKTGSTVKGESKPETHNKVHSVRSFEKWCPDCGVKNPNYVKPLRECGNCGSPAGTEAKVCWHCGSKHLEDLDPEEDDDYDEEEE